MKKGIAIYSGNVIVIDGYVWELGGREATFMGAYGARIDSEASMSVNPTWGKRITIGELGDHERMLFSCLMAQVCINPKMPTILDVGMKVRLR